MTPDKKRKEQERERMTSKGFKRFEAWVHYTDLSQVRKYIERLNKQRGVA